MSVCEKMQEVREQRRCAAETRANELAYKDASGEPVEPVEALEAVAAAGLPDDWFPKRVAHYRTRAGHLAMIASEPEILRTKAAAEKAQEEAKAKFEKAQAEFAAAWNPAKQAIEAARGMLNDIGGAVRDFGKGALTRPSASAVGKSATKSWRPRPNAEGWSSAANS